MAKQAQGVHLDRHLRRALAARSEKATAHWNAAVTSLATAIQGVDDEATLRRLVAPLEALLSAKRELEAIGIGSGLDAVLGPTASRPIQREASTKVDLWATWRAEVEKFIGTITAQEPDVQREAIPLFDDLIAELQQTKARIEVPIL